jgi:hypothetical protein
MLKRYKMAAKKKTTKKLKQEPTGNALHNVGSVEHGTPEEVVDLAHKVMGGIDLDPASSRAFNKVVKAKRIHSVGRSGLTKEWKGRVFLNPPGGMCDAKGKRVLRVKGKGYVYEDGKKAKEHFSAACLWWFKLVHEWHCGNVEGIFMGFSLELLQRAQQYAVRDDLPWDFSDADKRLAVLPMSFPRVVPSKRLKFCQEVDGVLKPGTSPTHANVIIFLPRRGGTVAHSTGQFYRHAAPLGCLAAPSPKPPKERKAGRLQDGIRFE